MKKFTILMGLFLATMVTGQAMAQTVTLTMEDVNKIEQHIVGLNTQIEALEKEIAELKSQAKIKKNSDTVLEDFDVGKDSDVVDTKPSNISCKQLGELASEIMRLRQDGTPMSHAMEIADGNPVMIAMVKLAYSETRWSTDKSKTTAIQDFVIVNEQLCYNSGFENR